MPFTVAAHDVPQPQPGGEPQPQRLPLDRTHRRSGRAGHAVDLPDQRPAASTTVPAAIVVPSRSAHAGAPARRTSSSAALDATNSTPRAVAAAVEQRRVQQPRVDLVVVRGEQAAGQPGRERRFELAQLARR